MGVPVLKALLHHQNSCFAYQSPEGGAGAKPCQWFCLAAL